MKIQNMKIKIEFIDYKEMPFTTLGYWKYEKQEQSATDILLNYSSAVEIVISICRMSDWRFEASVLIHELIEVFWCLRHGVTTEQCDEYDTYYELGYKIGEIDKREEAGYGRLCPYKKGHVWGDRFARVFDWLVGIDKNKFREEADRLMGIF